MEEGEQVGGYNTDLMDMDISENLTLGQNVSNVTSCEEQGTCYFFTADSRYGGSHFALPLLGVIWPLLTMVTLTSNTLIILVLTRPLMRSPTNLVLLAMAVCDLLTIICPAPWFVYLFTLGNYNTMGWTGPLCYMFEFMIDTAPQLFHSASNLLTLALAVQRYIYVCHATTAKQWCTIARSKVVICLILTLSVAHMVSRTADRNYSTIMTDGANGTAIIPVCRVEFSHWLTAAPNSLTIYFNTYFWFRVLFVQLFPCISLVILNILLFSAMRRAESRRRRLTVNRNTPKVQPAATSRRASLFGLSRENRRQRDANSTTMMLIVVIAVFLVVEIPLAVMSALHTISSSVHEFMNYELARDIVLFIDTTICLSYPVNFAIYCGMSRQFRTTFSSLILTPCIRLVKPTPSPDENIEENPERSKWNNGAGPSTKITKATVAGTTEANGLLTTNF